MEGHFILNRHFNVSNERNQHNFHSVLCKIFVNFPIGWDWNLAGEITNGHMSSKCLFIGSFWHFSQTVLLELVFAFLCPLKGHERGEWQNSWCFRGAVMALRTPHSISCCHTVLKQPHKWYSPFFFPEWNQWGSFFRCAAPLWAGTEDIPVPGQGWAGKVCSGKCSWQFAALIPLKTGRNSEKPGTSMWASGVVAQGTQLVVLFTYRRQFQSCILKM